MKHSDFSVGMRFYTAAGAWRCTDIGRRVIIAISLQPRLAVRSTLKEDGSFLSERYVSLDPRDLAGPPYGVPEMVFDEYDIKGCAPVPEAWAGGRPSQPADGSGSEDGV